MEEQEDYLMMKCYGGSTWGRNSWLRGRDENGGGGLAREGCVLGAKSKGEGRRECQN